MASTAATSEIYSYNNVPPLEIFDQDLDFLHPDVSRKELTQRCKTTLLKTSEKYHIYRCIQSFTFLTPRITDYTNLPSILTTLKSNPQKLVLDVGCCYGTCIRYLIHHGVHPRQIIASDLHSGYFSLSLHHLFQDQATIDDIVQVFGNWALEAGTYPGSLLIANRIDFIFASAVLHVLNKAQGHVFLRNVFDALAPGGILTGSTGGASISSEWLVNDASGNQAQGDKRYLHSHHSLSSLLERVGFVEVDVVEMDRGLLRALGKAVDAGAVYDRFRRDGNGVRLYFHFTCRKPMM